MLPHDSELANPRPTRKDFAYAGANAVRSRHYRRGGGMFLKTPGGMILKNDTMTSLSG